MLNHDQIKQLINAYEDPFSGINLGDSHTKITAQSEGSSLNVSVTLGYPAKGHQAQMVSDLTKLLQEKAC